MKCSSHSPQLEKALIAIKTQHNQKARKINKKFIKIYYGNGKILWILHGGELPRKTIIEKMWEKMNMIFSKSGLPS